jgi:hypothetical protein
MRRKEEEEQQKQKQKQNNHPKQPAELEGIGRLRRLTLLSSEQAEERKSLKPTKWLKL